MRKNWNEEEGKLEKWSLIMIIYGVQTRVCVHKQFRKVIDIVVNFVPYAVYVKQNWFILMIEMIEKKSRVCIQKSHWHSS